MAFFGFASVVSLGGGDDAEVVDPLVSSRAPSATRSGRVVYSPLAPSSVAPAYSSASFGYAFVVA